MDTVYTYIGTTVFWIVSAAAAVVAVWVVYIYVVGLVRSIRFIQWLDRHARKDPDVSIPIWSKIRAVIMEWHNMAMFNPKTDTISVRGGETFRG